MTDLPPYSTKITDAIAAALPEEEGWTDLRELMGGIWLEIKDQSVRYAEGLPPERAEERTLAGLIPAAGAILLDVAAKRLMHDDRVELRGAVRPDGTRTVLARRRRKDDD